VTFLLILLSMAIGVVVLRELSRRDGPLWKFPPPIVLGALAIWIWQLACRGFAIPRVLLPAPSEIGVAIATHLPMLAADFHQTFLRAVLPGWIMGCTAGFLCAIALDLSAFLRRGVLPLAGLASAMPIVGVAPIMVMWFGFDWQSKAAVVVLMTFFPMLINATAGLAQASAMERDLMRSYAATGAQTLLKLRLPGAMPFVFTALKLNATLALIGAIVAEFFGTPIVGMGFRISTEAAKLDMDVVWAEIAMAAAAGAASFAVLSALERATTFWHASFR
jgi:NitT/TauT family transport system permease protein